MSMICKYFRFQQFGKSFNAFHSTFACKEWTLEVFKICILIVCHTFEDVTMKDNKCMPLYLAHFVHNHFGCHKFIQCKNVKNNHVYLIIWISESNKHILSIKPFVCYKRMSYKEKKI